ncbi:hypothetical protein NLJ89_g2118 [Agrocybe chaxingu]|uniref:Uracil-DNA glycosylase-like domain-containing protein n=1 Tax=Agrocybe chaxingu TaxID=84603 RepID=A0A9W8MYA2_9AGAR|nr:hypothetical protein NLJ89_g2118 [Agrocybe chaxingu]
MGTRFASPGEQSAQIGHHYGNPTNHFWSCLHESGLTSRRLDPREDHLLPKEFSMGLTNLQNDLSKAEQTSGVPLLLEKVARYRPLILCFVGLGIADIVRSGVGSGSKNDLKGKAAFGLQPYKMVHPYDEADSHQQFRDSSDPHDARNASETLFFAVSSTSGRVVRYQKADKIEQFKQLRAVLRDMKTGGLDTSKLTTVSTPPTSTPTPSASKDRLGMDETPNENPFDLRVGFTYEIEEHVYFTVLL